ncbi:DNA cross-link repair 1A protein [Aplochiton taeniatus]
MIYGTISLSRRRNDSNHVKSEGEPKTLITHSVSTQSIQKDVLTSDYLEEGPSLGDFCPLCQMPFSILVVQSRRWHVADCLDSPGDQRNDCPDGLQCSSTIPSHYKKYSHTMLAHSRATNDGALLSLSQERTFHLGAQSSKAPNFVSEDSEDSAMNLSTFSSPSASECSGSTTPSKQTNALLLLRSPKPEDIRKRKGWTPVKGLKSTSASQEGKTKSSTPCKASIEAPPLEGGFVQESSEFRDDEISYSPLSEFPDVFEVNSDSPKKLLCPDGENYDSILLFRDGLSSEDELFGELAEIKQEAEVEDSCFDSNQNPKDPEMAEPEANNQQQSATGENSRGRGGRQRKQRGASTAATGNDTGTVTDNGSPQSTQGRGGRGGGRTWRREKADEEPKEPKRCPFYKKIPGTKVVVDAFSYGVVEGITAYFLTHFHSDHYGGLKKSSTFPIYCNKVTGNLVKSKLRVAEQHIHILPMNTEVTVEGVKVLLLDANHCPGAAMLLFFLPDGQTVLHTGDFRADPSMETYTELVSCRVQTLYLDTTYCSPEYTFPTQQEVITFAANTAFECVTLQPRTLVVCGSYSVGKEKVFLALAEVLGSKVCLSRDKYNIMCCLDSEPIKRLATTDWNAGQVHVLPMMQLNFKNLQAHLSRFRGQYDQLVAFKPTGWTFSQKVEAVEDIVPQTRGDISIYGIPYSEHSSFLEMKRFVQWLQPLKIIPTVNAGSWGSRKAMEKCFGQWLAEARTKAAIKDWTMGSCL